MHHSAIEIVAAIIAHNIDSTVENVETTTIVEENKV